MVHCVHCTAGRTEKGSATSSQKSESPSKCCLNLFMRVVVHAEAVHLDNAVTVPQSGGLGRGPRFHLADVLAMPAALRLHSKPETATVVPRPHVTQSWSVLERICR